MPAKKINDIWICGELCEKAQAKCCDFCDIKECDTKCHDYPSYCENRRWRISPSPTAPTKPLVEGQENITFQSLKGFDRILSMASKEWIGQCLFEFLQIERPSPTILKEFSANNYSHLVQYETKVTEWFNRWFSGLSFEKHMQEDEAMSQGINSLFVSEAWGGFDFNEDGRFAPGRALKGGPDAYVMLENKKDNRLERYDTPNRWLCLIDVAACMLIDAVKHREVDYIEAINLVHLHELVHACDDGDTSIFEKGRYSHTYYWNKIMVSLSRMGVNEEGLHAFTYSS